MNPVSIILAIAFLGLLDVFGAILLWFGARKVRAELAHFGNPHILFGIAGLSMRVLMMATGATLVTFGTLGTYRVIWGF